MLKSTHKATSNPSPLPPGWTEHKAPSGHLYYYNAATKTSTYARPSTGLSDPAAPQVKAQGSAAKGESTPLGYAPTSAISGGPNAAAFGQSGPVLQPSPYNTPSHWRSNRKTEPEDRPRSKQLIPGCTPWVLVRTKLGRRFVHNLDQGESFWRFPPEVMKHVTELDRKERENKEREERGEAKSDEGDAVGKGGESPAARSDQAAANGAEPGYDSDEYEEVEVTDNEDEDGASKRHKTGEGEPEGPVEFNEDDIAYQLASMGQDEQMEWDQTFQDAALGEEDSEALFIDMLEDFRINPFVPWESIIEEGKVIEDDRYTCLSNMKTRKEVWGRWSTAKIQEVKEKKQLQEKTDPRIPYLAFLQKNATPKLFWAEFRRKYKKEPEMRDTKLSDKDREKWYREYINRLKLPESTLKSDLSALLRSQPLELLNRDTSLEALPPPILIDMRYVSLRPRVRDPLIEAYVAIQPHAPKVSELSPEDTATAAKQREERERREKALAERERRVQEEKRRRDIALRHSKGVLREGEEDIERAMKVGREGLLGHFQDDHQQSAK